MKTNINSGQPIDALRALIRGQTHGGYAWAAVMDDCGFICNRCARENARRMLTSTRDKARDGWQVIGLANSGEHEGSAVFCAHCNRVIFEEE